MHRLETTLTVTAAEHDRYVNRLAWLCAGRHATLKEAFDDADSRGFQVSTGDFVTHSAGDPTFGPVARLGLVHGRHAWLPLDRRCIDGTCLHRGSRHLGGLR